MRDTHPVWSDSKLKRAGMAAVVGGLLGLAATPFIVIVKYATGWSIVPRPAWEGAVRPFVEPLVSFASPVQLWMFYGAIYTIAMLLMFRGVLALRARTAANATRAWRVTLRALMVGLVLVIVGDALHSLTWHLGGETLPRPGLNPIAGFGIAMAYLGLPIVFIASFSLGAMAWAGRRLPRLIAVLLLAVGPGGALLTGTQLPAMPSGSLAIFALAMTVFGFIVASQPRSDSASTA